MLLYQVHDNHCPTLVRKIVFDILCDVFIVSVHSRVASFLGFPASSFWSLSIAQLMSQVLDISSYREAGETRQVPVERQVLLIEHNQAWTRTDEGWFRYKRCKSKSSFFFATLATFCHCAVDISRVSFGNPSELCLLAQICFVRLMLLSVGTCLHSLIKSHRIIYFVRIIRNCTVGDNMWSLCYGSCGKKNKTGLLSLFLQTESDQKLKVRRPGNKPMADLWWESVEEKFNGIVAGQDIVRASLHKCKTMPTHLDNFEQWSFVFCYREDCWVGARFRIQWNYGSN